MGDTKNNITPDNSVEINNSAANIPVDGDVVISVRPDFSTAYITIYGAQNGGRDLSYDDIINALRAKAVSYNIDTARIRSAVQTKMFDKEFVAAQADMPQNGIDGTVTYKFSKESVLAPKEDEHGFVDYKNLGLIRNIRENETIAEITLPTEGTPGKDIRGLVMRAIPGKKASYNIGTGTKLSDDGTRIYAIFDGHVCFKNNAFCVENTVTISGDIDASVGNIEFLGDVIVKGEVMEGFSITAGKDVTVSGNVTGADIHAGGAITIKKGSINSNLMSHGDISCQFCEHSKIRTDGNVNGQSFVICDVYCGQDLKAKALNGGKYTVLGDTEVTYLGTKNYAPTEVIAGDNAVLNKEKELLNKRITELDSQIGRCTQIVDFLTEKRKQLKHLPEDKEELLGNMVKAKLTCKNEKKQSLKRIAEIDMSLSQKQYRSIICKGTAYPGVKVTINDAVMKIENETPRVKIYLNGDGLITTGQV